jgi:RHS repeat-associated protein
LGRRIEKTVNSVITQYVYDGLDIIQEIQGGVKTNYIRTLNIDEPLARIKADGTIQHYKSDALGSVIALTDDTGAVKTNYTYDPFGNITVSGENSDNPFQYTGRENDGTGLYYYRARYYSPELQRFVSEDPVDLRGGINFYTYVGNSPINWRDPSGLIFDDWDQQTTLPDWWPQTPIIDDQDLQELTDFAKCIADKMGWAEIVRDLVVAKSLETIADVLEKKLLKRIIQLLNVVDFGKAFMECKQYCP